MTQHLILALGVRLFAVWCALVMVRELAVFLSLPRPSDESAALGVMVSGSIIVLIILLTMWFFPKSIARGLLPQSSDAAPAQPSSYEMWFTLGIALIGLWFVASAITPILHNLGFMYFFKSSLMTQQDLSSLRAGIFYSAIELVLGLLLLFGATGVRKLILRIRKAIPD